MAGSPVYTLSRECTWRSIILVLENNAISNLLYGRAFYHTTHQQHRVVRKDFRSSNLTYEKEEISDYLRLRDGNKWLSKGNLEKSFQEMGRYNADNSKEYGEIYRKEISEENHPELCFRLSSKYFTVYYNKVTKTPCWVYECLTPDSLSNPRASRRDSKFKEDSAVDERHRSTLADYKSSGYDRGHMASAANHRSSSEAMNQTFLLSNILPQRGPGFNQDIWRHLEEGIRDIARRSDCVHLYTGPLYLPRRQQDGLRFVTYPVIGGNKVAVPTHLFKTMLVVQRPGECEIISLLSFMMPNKEIPSSCQLEDFITSADDIESLSGMRFFFFLKTNNITCREILGEEDDKNGLIETLRARRQQKQDYNTKHWRGY